MALKLDPEWVSDPETQAFLREIQVRRQRQHQRLLVLCKQGDSLLEVRATSRRMETYDEIINLLTEGAEEDAEGTQKEGA